MCLLASPNQHLYFSRPSRGNAARERAEDTKGRERRRRHTACRYQAEDPTDTSSWLRGRLRRRNSSSAGPEVGRRAASVPSLRWHARIPRYINGGDEWVRSLGVDQCRSGGKALQPRGTRWDYEVGGRQRCVQAAGVSVVAYTSKLRGRSVFGLRGLALAGSTSAFPSSA